MPLETKDYKFSSSSLRWFAKTSVRRPRLVALVGLSVPILVAIIAFVAFPLEIDTGGGTYYPRNSIIGRLEDTLKISEEITVFNPLATEEDDIEIEQQTSNNYMLTLYFKRKGGKNVLTTDSFNFIKGVENKIMDHTDGDTKYEDICYRGPNSTDCAPPLSLTTYTYSQTDDACPDILIPNGLATEGRDVHETLKEMEFGNSTGGDIFCNPADGECYTGCMEPNAFYEEYVSKDFTIENGHSDVTRSTFTFGLPLKGYKHPRDRRDDQIKIIEDWVAGLKGYLDGASKDGIKVRYLSPILISMHFESLIFGDVAFIFVSIILVYLFMCLHMQSGFLAGFGMLHVILSFPFAYFFLQLFLDIGPMGILNFMALFIILGIGADDIFIYVDAWKQSEHYVVRDMFPEGDDGNLEWLEGRFTFAYKRSGWAMLVTSLTTSAAFMMNLSSSVPSIQIFGFFTAFMVMTNYFMVITYYPALVMWWHLHIENWFHLPCFKAKDEVKDRTPKKSEAHVDIDNMRFLERFFYNTYAPGVFKLKYIIIFGFTIFFGISVYYATTLQEATEPTKWLPDDDPIQEVFTMQQNDFSRSDGAVQTWFVNGLNPIDRKGSNPFDSTDLGKVKFDTNFDPNSPGFQMAYMYMCSTLRDFDRTLDREVLCPMELFQDYVQDVLGESFPVPDDVFVAKMANFTAYVESVEGPAYNAAEMKEPDERNDRRYLATTYSLIRFEPDDPTKLRYMATVVNVSIGLWEPGSKIEPFYDDYEALSDRFNSNETLDAVTLGDGFQTSPQWVDMELDRVLLYTAVVGIAASLSIAFVIILISTTDLIITCLSILTIGGTVASLIAFIVWMGWQMSIIESICLTILVGLSVDYTIHLANAWRLAKVADREERLRIALTEIGISVFSASITTFLSCSALFFTTVLFFVKFGIFIALTIMFSCIYSFGMFTALCCVAGTTSNRNDFYAFYLLVTGQEQPEPKREPEPKDSISLKENQGMHQVEVSVI